MTIDYSLSDGGECVSARWLVSATGAINDVLERIQQRLLLLLLLLKTVRAANAD